MVRATFGFVLIVVLAMSAGCGKGSTSETNYVEGKVTLGGAPLSGATVTFSPVTGSAGAAVGTTDSNGVYKLTDMQGGGHDQGTAAGEYKVGIVKVIGGAATDPDAWKSDPNYGKTEASHTTPSIMKSEIPVSYNNPESSGLKATIKAGKNEGVDFALKKG